MSLDAAAKTLAQILQSQHPGHTFIVKVREREADHSTGTAGGPHGNLDAGPVLDGADSVVKTLSGSPAPGSLDDHHVEKAA
jgi:hypothetical protein